MNDRNIDFEKLAHIALGNHAVIPVVAQDAKTGEVLILAYANKEALHHSFVHKIATFWSTSRNELWIKGATSGNFLQIVEIRINCENNALLYRVTPKSKGACHTQNKNGHFRKSCFYRILHSPKDWEVDETY